MKGRAVIVALILSALVVAFAAAFASTHPDGLESVANGLGFAGRVEPADVAPLAGYELPTVEDSFLSTFIAGLIGILSVFTLVFLLGKSISGFYKHHRTIRHRA